MEDNNSYLIPANSKKSSLILGFFTKLDLIIFSVGVGLSVLLLMILGTQTFLVMVVLMLPALIASFLVLPVPYYHNMRQLITNIVGFLLNRRRYYWKGWCVTHDEESK